MILKDGYYWIKDTKWFIAELRGGRWYKTGSELLLNGAEMTDIRDERIKAPDEVMIYCN